MSNLLRFLEACIPHDVKDRVMEARVVRLPVAVGTSCDATDCTMQAGVSSFSEIRQVQGASGLEDTTRLPESENLGIRLEMVEHESGQDPVEGGVRKGELLREGRIELHTDPCQLSAKMGHQFSA
jgi:hypothetical protein